MNQQEYKKLISGQKKGFEASIARFLLTIVSLIYLLIIRIRNFLYSTGWLKIQNSKVPVISIGNITTGGTGKTPFVIWIYKLLSENSKFKNLACGILTRGYKTKDEPRILEQSCPEAKIIINPDRAAAAKEAAKKYNLNIFILDDGFQHRRLNRDLDIVLIDATCPFGYGKMLPAGLLRESADSLKRADAIVITRCDLITETELQNLINKIQNINKKAVIAKSIHSSICTLPGTKEQINKEYLNNKKVFAFCGIGNPEAFFEGVKKTGANLTGSKIYNDHHEYSKDNIDDIFEEAEYLGVELILTTRKDWVKISADYLLKEMPLGVMDAEIKFIEGQDKLKELIETALTGKIWQ